MRLREERLNFRKIRARSKLYGTPVRPRLSVYRSLNHIYAQVIDDTSGKTLASASSKAKGFPKASGMDAATKVGETVAKKLSEKGIKSVVFDRGGRPYHGRVKAVADGARQGGLKF